MADVELTDMKKVYPDGVVGAEDIDLLVEDGEFVILVGPSGCGKTTTLQTIAGLQRPSEGTIRIGDTVVNDVKPQNRDIAMVFQDYALYPHKTVKENMMFGLRYTSGMSKSEMEDQVAQYAEMLSIDHLLDQKPGQLSGGQQQRVALGRAMVRDPDVFLLDEPLSNLDAKLRTEMRAELQRLQNDLNVTTIYVTHDQTEAMTMADRIVVMNKGHIQQVGTPIEVYNQPANAFVAQFIGSPSMNMIDAQFENGIVHTDYFQYKLESTELDPSVTQGQFGIRPEDIQVVEDSTTSSVQARVDVVEELGSENLLHLTLSDETSIVARVNEAIHPTIDDIIELQFPEERVCLFAENGRTIKYREVPERAGQPSTQIQEGR
ncbi:ABC transporter ATP-binding protein [Haloarcula nitratireducens]|uniref:ABC-type D-xylose/L-arabinose transporter n=1 Tax=Haloarcula nitratireducens TaxID=2487749 RepID=A0AAW4PH52_9EURY|nr:ABC transporter ATP-binding protein [Halomicroarcula nitratireducens]MBX0296953.1 ABC transporter ATP-binding protein [Halomicroarcula nitratireducens]